MMRALIATVSALAVAALLAVPAAAHTAMLRASPDRDAIVGGSIGFVDLEFLDPVSEASVTVTYNGAPVAGRTTVTAGQVITFALDQPLTQPGRYQVDYEMISSDNDFTTGGYFFTFDPAAAPAGRIEASESSGGFSTATLALAGAGLAVLVGLLALLAWRTGNRRRAQVLDTSVGHDAEFDHWDPPRRPNAR